MIIIVITVVIIVRSIIVTIITMNEPTEAWLLCVADAVRGEQEG